MNYKIIEKELFGIKNPKVRIKIKSYSDIKKIQIFVNNKLYSNYNNSELKIINGLLEMNLTFPISTQKIKIIMILNSEEITILDKHYCYFIRFLKVVSKPFRVIFNFIYSLFHPIFKSIKLMWVRHHFLIPPKKIKRYFKSFVRHYKSSPVSTFYDPENQNQYNKWLNENKYEIVNTNFKYTPLISIIIPVYNANGDVLRSCIDSVLKQSYDNFEICIADDNSNNDETKLVLKEYEKNKKIKIKYRKVNGMISKCMNSALELAEGEFVGFLDNDDVLDENALYYMVEKLNNNRKLDLIYSDEDKVDERNNYCDPNFKPDWAPDTFLSMNYICHFTIIRRNLIKKVGGFRSEYDGAQDYDLFLRITEKTKNIGHISRILYHWRKSETSTAAKGDNKDYARLAGKKALEDALKRRNIYGQVLLDNKSPFYIIDYKLKKEPKISIIIPTKDHKILLEKCISSIYNKTTYKNFEIVIIDNNTTEQDAIDYLNYLEENYSNIVVIHDNSEFNFSKINNDAIKKVKADYVLLLNNDTEIITPNWLTTMVGYASQNHIGCVGAKLLYSDETIQHAGVILGLGGVASHAYIGADRKDIGYFGRLCVPYNYSANTAACLMVSKKKYDEVNGLDELLKVAYNDIDFNIKLLEKGYYNVFLPQVELFHYESKSRGFDTTPEKKERFKSEEKYMYDKWGKIIYNDRFYNSNFSLKGWFVLDRSKK